jgi:ABC-type antimicrobial peptide transport system permease subunit
MLITHLVRIKAGAEQQTITGVRNLFSKFNNGLEFNYSFLDDDFNKLYASEHRVADLSKYFAGIAILISCLGLFGLAAFTAQKRQKEIGIRKVIGASVSNVVTMLSKDFLVLVSISLLVAIPLSWWLMNAWLQSFRIQNKYFTDCVFDSRVFCRRDYFNNSKFSIN